MIEHHSVPSPTLGEDMRATVVRPETAMRLPVFYLLHGRGDTAESWTPVLADLAAMPLIAVLLDAPWSTRASYYVDSLHEHGRPVETAITRDLVAWADAALPTDPRRDSRIVAGYSMGGYGALRLGLAHPHLFGAIVALSPAAYVPGPPDGSSAREFGAFGRGDIPYDPDWYAELNYPAALDTLSPRRPLHLTIAVGDAEPEHPGAPAVLSIAHQAQQLARRARRVVGLNVTYATYQGGHDFSVWRQALRDALAGHLARSCG